MTFLVGTKVHINPLGNYPDQGKLDGKKAVGIVISNVFCQDWLGYSTSWDVKVRWEYQEDDDSNYYNCQRDLIAISPSKKTFSNLL